MINSGIAYIDFNNITVDLQTAASGTVSGSITNAKKYADKIRKAAEAGKTICCKNIHITVPSSSAFMNVKEIFNGFFNVNSASDEGFTVTAVRGCGNLAPNAKRVVTAYIEHNYALEGNIYFNVG